MAILQSTRIYPVLGRDDLYVQVENRHSLSSKFHRVCWSRSIQGHRTIPVAVKYDADEIKHYPHIFTSSFYILNRCESNFTFA